MSSGASASAGRVGAALLSKLSAGGAGGWQAIVLDYRPGPLEPEATVSQWIALSRNPRAIAALRALDPDWTPLAPRPGFAAWTDDYSTILPLLKWQP